MIKLNEGWVRLTKICPFNYEISYIETYVWARGKGIGSKLLNKVIQFAHKKNVTIFAFIDPHSQSPLNKETERAWLKRYGFKNCPDDFYFISRPKETMVYIPK